MTNFLTEDAVVDAVISYLKREGWAIKSSAHATQTGNDVVATIHDVTLRVEAKGAGSSKPFSWAQAKSHIAVAGDRAMTWPAGDVRILALPDDETYRALVAERMGAYRLLGLGVFWVSPEGVVSIEA